VRLSVHRAETTDLGTVVVSDAAVTIGGFLITSRITNVEITNRDTAFVLILEKDAIFHRICSDGFLLKYPNVILITGKGSPCFATRRLVAMLYRKFRLPMFAVLDANPYGIEILMTYCHGSQAAAFEVETLAVYDNTHKAWEPCFFPPFCFSFFFFPPPWGGGLRCLVYPHRYLSSVLIYIMSDVLLFYQTFFSLEH